MLMMYYLRQKNRYKIELEAVILEAERGLCDGGMWDTSVPGTPQGSQALSPGSRRGTGLATLAPPASWDMRDDALGTQRSPEATGGGRTGFCSRGARSERGALLSGLTARASPSHHSRSPLAAGDRGPRQEADVLIACSARWRRPRSRGGRAAGRAGRAGAGRPRVRLRCPVKAAPSAGAGPGFPGLFHLTCSSAAWGKPMWRRCGSPGRERRCLLPCPPPRSPALPAPDPRTPSLRAPRPPPRTPSLRAPCTSPRTPCPAAAPRPELHTPSPPRPRPPPRAPSPLRAPVPLSHPFLRSPLLPSPA